MNRVQLLLSTVVGVSSLFILHSNAETTLVSDSAKVIRTSGSVRVSTGADPARSVWHGVQAGNSLPEGSTVQTGLEKRSSMDLALGARQTSLSGGANNPSQMLATRQNYEPSSSTDVVHMSEDTTLRLEKLSFSETGAETTANVSLDLQKGRITGRVNHLSGASSYQVKTPKGVLTTSGGVYEVSAAGLVRVVSGSVDVTPGGGAVQRVAEGQQVDLASGQSGPIPAADLATLQSTALAMRSTVPAGTTSLMRDRTVEYVSPNR